MNNGTESGSFQLNNTSSLFEIKTHVYQKGNSLRVQEIIFAKNIIFLGYLLYDTFIIYLLHICFFTLTNKTDD